ncbi:MAG: DUF1641 domain-containing protein [Bacteroidales bacterium]|nr:DUF1641 domain-containing protein [Bacteroidales bacterium]
MEVKTDNVQEQINQINQKLDLVLTYVNDQRLKSESIEDLVSDLSIISKDVFTSTVEELDNRGIELNVEDIKLLAFKLIRNVNNFSQVMDMFESLTDLLKDVGPIINEAGIDFTHKMHEFEQKGYFEFFKQMANLFDNAVVAYQKTDFDQNKKYSMFKIIREINSPEVKRTLGFMITFLKNISKESITNK